MAVEDQAQDYALRAFEGGTRIVIRLSAKTAQALLSRLGLRIRKTKTKIHDIRHNTGKVSMDDLRKTRQPLQVVEINPAQRKNVTSQLKQAGIAFHVERDRTGNVYLHFASPDTAEVKHVVDKVVARLDSKAQQQERDQPDGNRSMPGQHRKTKSETVAGIKRRAAKRVDGAQHKVPLPTRTRTR